jgi:hypothetical protein
VKQQSAANGHRFVFHYQEIKARERKYVAGEPGVNPWWKDKKRSASRVGGGNGDWDKGAFADGDEPIRKLRQGDTVYWSMLAACVYSLFPFPANYLYASLHRYRGATEAANVANLSILIEHLYRYLSLSDVNLSPIIQSVPVHPNQHRMFYALKVRRHLHFFHFIFSRFRPFIDLYLLVWFDYREKERSPPFRPYPRFISLTY